MKFLILLYVDYLYMLVIKKQYELIGNWNKSWVMERRKNY